MLSTCFLPLVAAAAPALGLNEEVRGSNWSIELPVLESMAIAANVDTESMAIAADVDTESMAIAADVDTESMAIAADYVYTVSGGVIENGFVRIQGGKIVATGPGDGGAEIRVAAITPGLIDLSPQISPGNEAVEQVAESTPHIRAIEAFNPFSYRWDRELRSGVTTALVAVPDRNVIGGLSAAVKTGGPETVEDRLLKADVALRGAMGSEPSSGNRPAGSRGPTGLFNRRPTTRMGVEWIARKSFYDALAAKNGGGDGHVHGLDQLVACLEGKLPLMLKAGTTQDIRTAIYLKEEFGIGQLVLDGAAEAWKEPEMLVRSGASVVLPPFSWDGRSDTDGGFMAWNNAAMLEELGVPFALSGRGSLDHDERLYVQPAYAVRGGASRAAALAAVTLTPAKILGLEDRVGSLEVGKDADLCLWSGQPGEFTAAVVGVVLNGELVVEPRSE
jgi:imidazolonepropionase-like amidohydrolase